MEPEVGHGKATVYAGNMVTRSISSPPIAAVGLGLMASAAVL